MKKVEIGDAIRYGWGSIKKDFWYLVALAAIVTILSSIFNSRREFDIWDIVGYLVTTYVTCGQLRILLDYNKGEKRPLADLFTQSKYFWRILGASLLIALITTIGLILLIIPGFYWALKYQFTTTLIVDKDLGVFEAMRQSGELTKGVKWPLLGLLFTELGIIILGVICLVVGLFVAIPIIWLANIYIYRKLLAATNTEA